MQSIKNRKQYSIIIPAYQAHDVIERCLDSIGCGGSNFEVIIVSDERDSKEYCRLVETVKTYSVRRNISEEIVVVQNKGQHGPGAARNLGINQASGDYLWFVDADDEVDKNWQKKWDKAIQIEADIIIAGYTEAYENHENIVREIEEFRNYEKSSFVSRAFQKLQLEWLINSPCNKLFRRRFLQEKTIKFPEQAAMGEDLYFSLQAIDAAGNITTIPEIVYRYIKGIKDNHLCASFHKEAIDMTFGSWQLEEKILRDANSEFLPEMKQHYQDNIKAYCYDLEVDHHGTWNELQRIISAATDLKIIEKIALHKQIRAYLNYKYIHFRRVASRIKHRNDSMQ